MDAGCIAHDLDKRCCDRFKDIPFENWVRWAPGLSAASVAESLDWISASRHELASHRQQVPKAFKKYTRVEGVNFSLSIPLIVFWLIVPGIAPAKSNCTLDYIERRPLGA